MAVRASTLFMGKEFCPGYTLRNLRGCGAFGRVWEVENSEGQVIALKFLPCKDGDAAAREIRTIQMVRQLRHPNLIRIDQVWAHKGYVVIAMELAEGSLQDLLEAYQMEYGKALDAGQVCPLLSQAAAGLDFLNSRQHMINAQRVALQHCDVKPSNLLLFGERIKLCDFGLSSTTTSTLKFHRPAGTMDFTAPEVFSGRLSEWTDQYALAVSYYLLRSGRLPFDDTPKTFDPAYVRPEPQLNMVSPKERAILTRALARVPHERWPSSGAMMTELSRSGS